MIRKLLLAASISCVLLAIPRTTASSVTPFYSAVHQVVCDGGTGSAFLIDHNRWVSVAHVTDVGGCRIDGLPIVPAKEEGLDFATLKVAIKGRGFKVNCGGFKPGTWVFAAGFAGGNEWQTLTRHLVTFKDSDDGLRILLGSPVIPGMSGGPVFNADGEVVGTVNAYNKMLPVSYSRALKDTSLCH